MVPNRPAPNLFALVSNETSRIWVSTEGWKPAVLLVYNGFYYYDKVQLRVQTQPRIETELETGPNKLGDDLDLKSKLGLILTVLNSKFDCITNKKNTL